MERRAFLCAVMLCTGLGGAVQAADAPAELPPASFAGTQFVDSSGCAFMRAGVDGDTVWVPRLTRDRSPLCGLTPSFDRGPAAAPRAAPVVNRPAPAARKPASVRRAEAAAPRPVVTRSEGLKPARIYVPRGYRKVWADGRLNPKRGPRTAAGDAQMAMVWTDTVPRRLVKPAPAATPAAAPRYLKIGAYRGEPRATIARLQGLGVPVSRTRRGDVTVIYAGPFRSAAQVERAEARLARAGYTNLKPRK